MEPTMWEPHVPYEALSFQCIGWPNKESGRANVTSPSIKTGPWVGNSLCLSASYYFALRHRRSTSTLLDQAFSVKTRSESITESDTTESSSLSGHPQTPTTYIPTCCEPMEYRPGRLAGKKSQESHGRCEQQAYIQKSCWQYMEIHFSYFIKFLKGSLQCSAF